jgi:trans-aconitate 2-methyltransferase
VKSREWNSTTYDRISGPQFSWGKKVLQRVKLRGNELLLDAGCGTGKLTGELLRQLPEGRVIAVDLSRNMLVTARSNLQPRFSKHSGFVAADLQHLPFSGVFDGLFSTAAFHWISDHDALFRSLFRALRPGGWLVAQAGGFGNLARLLGRVDALTQRSDYARYLRKYHHPWEYPDPETEAARLRLAGFEEVETGLELAPTRFPGPAEFGEFVSNVILHRMLEYFPDDETGRGFIAALTREAGEDDPAYELDYVRLNMQARRPMAS